ncbi:MAG: ATP/GTP-binding protein [Leptolyngbya sp. DLM2.Bin27]|nr:MAG: ATP/GTP-binding protein [Leptolyngbya sp. DLM2.Bin27]
MTPNIKPKKSQIKSFSIKNLFGYKDVHIPFGKEALILIAENGSGKTTILNSLYYLLACKFEKLSDIEFDSMSIEFESGDKFELKKSEVSFSMQFNVHEIIYSLRKFIPVRDYEMLRREARKGQYSSAFRQRLLQIAKRYPTPLAYQQLTLLSDFSLQNSSQVELDELEEKLKKIKNLIQENFNEDILYFPTYRRIEEDLKNLGYEEEKFEQINFDENKGKLIQFGMDDVIARFNEIQSSIIDSTFNLFSEMSGEILSQFLDDTVVTQAMRDKIQPETLSIVLSRVGEKNISRLDREKIEELVASGDINASKYEQLVYFLSKLVDLYEKQKERDESINQFAKVCNKYLNKKQIIYDEASVKISIVQTRDNSVVEIKNLSSGEKQIISLFSKIYLESPKEFILLFDEPELSLSLEWQKLLLPDILNSHKCSFMLAVTHSPFIFDNELDLNARDLDIYVQEN